MKYKTFLEVAEALFYGRIKTLTESQGLSRRQMDAVYDTKDKFAGSPLKGARHRMWYCLFLHEVTK